MACERPIWIRNPRYFKPKRDGGMLRPKSEVMAKLLDNPGDLVRPYLLVPCGKCEDCLRRERNAWFVRMEREFARCRARGEQTVAVTITVAPKWYKLAYDNPSLFMRKFNERIRHKFGKSVKHIYFQEFGHHPQTGDGDRLHFHGFIYGFPCSYNEFRSVVADFGYLWLAQCKLPRIRYALKYVVKQINVVDNGVDIGCERHQRRFRRKFVSAGIGDYLGRFTRPSLSTSTWSYRSSFDHRNYTYQIPRYYNKYLSDTDKFCKSLYAADTYSRCLGGDLGKYLVGTIVEDLLPKGALSSRDRKTWLDKQMKMFNKPLNYWALGDTDAFFSFLSLSFFEQLCDRYHIDVDEVLINLNDLWLSKASLVT